MKNQVVLIRLNVPMTEPFRISSGEVKSKEAILVCLTMDGMRAVGEASPMAGSFYSSETPDSTWRFLAEQAVPQLIQRGFADDFFRREWFDPAGDPFAYAGLNGALWDLRSQAEERSIPSLLGTELGPIASGLAVGIYPNLPALIEACARYLRDGYRRLKIKIQPGWDWEPLQEVRRFFGDIPLMVDANAAYTEADFPALLHLDELKLLMIEQPLARENLDGHRRLQAEMTTPICLDESADSLENVRRAIAMKACRIVNVKIQRLAGLARAKEIIDLCAASEIPTWMGTMPELGIGALHALYLARHPNCTYPTDVEASSRWYVEDIIDPPLEVHSGEITIPSAHHHRPNVNWSAVDRYTTKMQVFSI